MLRNYTVITFPRQISLTPRALETIEGNTLWCKEGLARDRSVLNICDIGGTNPLKINLAVWRLIWVSQLETLVI